MVNTSLVDFFELNAFLLILHNGTFTSTKRNYSFTVFKTATIRMTSIYNKNMFVFKFFTGEPYLCIFHTSITVAYSSFLKIICSVDS